MYILRLKNDSDGDVNDDNDFDVITTLMVSNEFRTDTEFSSVSPPDNFSQIIFASAHSFIMEKISPFGYHCQCHHEIPINHEAYSYILFEF